MLRLAFVLGVALCCSCSPTADSTTGPLVFEPRFGKNVSTLVRSLDRAESGWASDFEWRDSNGVLRSLSELQGKIVLLNFWATWCPPCLLEMPYLNEIAQDYAADSVVVLGISIDASGNVYDKVERHHRGKNYVFQVVIDPHKEVYEDYVGTKQVAIPWTFVIDRDGAIYEVLAGQKDYDTFAASIESIL